MSEIKFCVLDIETTGLDPEKHRVLEVAMSLLDKGLNVVASFESMVTDSDTCLALAKLREQVWDSREDSKQAKFILDMHTKSGLIADIATAPYYRTIEDVEELMRDFLYKHGLVDSGEEDGEEGIKVYLAGSSIHFDVDFLNKYMPIVGHFYHRRLDVSGSKVVVDEYLPNHKAQRDSLLRSNSTHRAAADVKDSINELYWYLTNVYGVQIDGFKDPNHKHEFTTTWIERNTDAPQA